MGLSDLNRVNRFFPALFLMSLNNNISKAKKINLICVSTIKPGLYNYYSATTVNYIMRRFNELDYGLKYEQIHTHTVCVTYYKAAPYNISHT